MRTVQTIIAELLENKSVFANLDGYHSSEIVQSLLKEGFRFGTSEYANKKGDLTVVTNNTIRVEIVEANLFGTFTDIRTFFIN